MISNGKISNKESAELCQKLNKMFSMFTVNLSADIIICKDKLL